MANHKKVFLPIMSLLASNMDVAVADIFDQVSELAAAKTGGGGAHASSFHRNEDGVVVGIRCYYHKTWMSPDVAEFGKKANTPTGLNTMCKEGVSKWTKQQSEFKKAKESLLDLVSSGEIAPDQINAEIAKLEEQRDRIEPREDKYGFENLEDLLKDNQKRKVAA